jgi:hypothetical protein
MKSMKTASVLIALLSCLLVRAQMGEVWPVDNRQEFDVNEKLEIIKTYEATVVCEFFMFLNNNEFIHVTDRMTSLYKIIKRDESIADEPMYTVVSEAANTYVYIFNKKTNQVTVYSEKGYAISFLCLAKHDTKVFSNLNR